MRGLPNALRVMLPLLLLISGRYARRLPRGLELSTVHQLIADTRLDNGIYPLHYDLLLHPNVEGTSFSGEVKIDVYVRKEGRNTIELHAHHDLKIDLQDIELTHGTTKIEILRASRTPKKTNYVIRLKEPLAAKQTYHLKILFAGTIWETTVGMFRGQYVDGAGEKHKYVATNMRPNNARRLFPCFDEPQFKTPFKVSIARPRSFKTLLNTDLLQTTEYPWVPPNTTQVYVLDQFQVTRPMATFELGFVISKLTEVPYEKAEQTDDLPIIRIWARPEFHAELDTLRARIVTILHAVRRYINAAFPLPKLDVVAMPGFSALKPIDNFGLAVFKESDLATNGYYLLAQELIYQWFGNWISPMWWSDAHVNKALVGLIAAQVTLEINNGAEFDGKWPMTQLYSIYYEFSKRYPHSRITGLKQETTCTKTELVLRMLNYTMGITSFRDAVRHLFTPRFQQCAHREGADEVIKDKQMPEFGRHFCGEDLWRVLTAEGFRSKKLPPTNGYDEVVNSWITKDRLPVVTIIRDYTARTALVTQKVYLRERPHDVPEQDKMLWYIPLIVVQQDRLDFDNHVPRAWLERKRETVLGGMPPTNQFVIVNPEEIGPFPVNYDDWNWNLLAIYLQTEEGRQRIPMNTRAKLLHDAWNLAYAGDLSFSVAFNMTLFMKHEREHLVWNPVFTLIDHIGNHIDMSKVHKKFETYVRILLTPLYEELGPVAVADEEKWKENLRTLARLFLCRAGYKPCIEEAQAAYGKWMEAENPDEGNPVPNQYICPVFKWGTEEEWEFGLQRVINFPAARKQSERTYLLKCLVGCPIQKEKIERMLRLTLIEENQNFTENDISLQFNMLSSGSSGYINLFNFLSANWLEIRERLEQSNRIHLWDSLISSATGAFTTQEGYDMVAKLYADHRGEFGSAEHIIEKSLRNIKEETHWSAENLPVIERWLDDYLARAERSGDDMFA